MITMVSDIIQRLRVSIPSNGESSSLYPITVGSYSSAAHGHTSNSSQRSRYRATSSNHVCTDAQCSGFHSRNHDCRHPPPITNLAKIAGSTHAVSVLDQGELGNSVEGDNGPVEPTAPSHGSGRAVTADDEQLLSLHSNLIHYHDADSRNHGVRSPASPEKGQGCEKLPEEREEEQCRLRLSQEVTIYFGNGNK